MDRPIQLNANARKGLLVAAICFHVLVGAMAFVHAPDPAPDFDRYYQIATGTGRPYVDYQVEHPIGTWLVFKALAAPGSRGAFARGVVLLNGCADAVIVVSLLGAWGAPAAAYYAVVAAPIADLLFNRIDLWSMAAATLAVAAWRTRRSDASAVALAVGASLKLWPLILATSLLQRPSSQPRYAGTRPVRAVVIFALTGGALAALALTLAGGRAIFEVLTFRSATGWQIESMVGSVLHLFGGASSGPIRLESGSWRIGLMGGRMSIAAFAAAGPVCIWVTWLGFRRQMPGTGWLAAVSILFSFSALLSAQYVGWLIPGGALAWVEGNRRSALLAACAVVLTQLFWMFYGAVLSGARFALALVVIRNVVVIVLAIDASRSLLEADLQTKLPPV
jgi:hypothetical protein